MRMIPAIMSELTQSRAERRLFRLLEQTRLGKDSCCFHSLELSKHDYKLCAEIDFLIVQQSRVLVLEVKGGGVARRDGVWFFTDRFGADHRRSEGPFEQARSAMFGLRQKLEDQFGAPAIRTLVFGYGVVFPDCDFREKSVEWDSEMILDASDLRDQTDLSAPLERLIGYWDGKHGNQSDPPHGFESRLLQFIRPSFERIPSLRNRADALDCAMESLTNEQYSRLDIIQGNDRILCSGGAGTGKTFLALEVARRHASQGARVLLLCGSRPMAAFLHSRCRSASIEVNAADDGFPNAGAFDVMVVDEGQDLINLDILSRLDALLLGGLEKGVWRFFFDANSQAGLAGRFEPDALELLQSYGATSARLSLNCRNTNEIVIQTKLLTGSDIGTPSAGAGPPVRYEFYDSRAREALLVDEYWGELMSAEVPPGDVSILSPVTLEETCLPLTRVFRKNKLTSISSETVPAWPFSNLTFSRIVDFKGLENRFVILIDLDATQEQDRLRKLLYVGMTRPRTGLYVAASETLRATVTAMAGNNLAMVLPDVEQNDETVR